MRLKDDIRRPALIAIIVSLGLVLFDIMMHMVWPDIERGSSWVLTIIVSALVAALGANFFFRKQVLLNQKLKQEIDERLDVEEVLRRSEEKYHDLFQNANDAIFIVDDNLFYVDVNKKAVEILSVPPARRSVTTKAIGRSSKRISMNTRKRSLRD